MFKPLDVEPIEQVEQQQTAGHRLRSSQAQSAGAGGGDCALGDESPSLSFASGFLVTANRGSRPPEVADRSYQTLNSPASLRGIVTLRACSN